MNKLIAIALIFAPDILWASSCNEIAAPNLSDLNWILTEQHTYADERLGSSIPYEKDGSSLTYYAYDFGLNGIDAAIVEEQLVDSIAEIYRMLAQYPELTSSDPMSMGEYVIDNMIAAGDFVHHAYVVESSAGNFKLMDALTLGSDGECFFKVRYTAALEYPSANPLTNGIDKFAEISHEFFSRVSD